MSSEWRALYAGAAIAVSGLYLSEQYLMCFDVDALSVIDFCLSMSSIRAI